MQGNIDLLLDHPLGALLGYFAVAILGLVVFLSFFEMVTKYNCWDEIRKGNLSVAMATGGKIFGICNILRFSIQSGDSIYETMKWSLVGFLLLLLAYFLFEFMTPVFQLMMKLLRTTGLSGLQHC